MRRYETIFILRPNIGEEEINQVIGYAADIIGGEKGTVIELSKWGMKKLAYLIKKESLGYYVFCDYAATPAAVSEIERKFRIDDTVLKYMTIKTAAAMSEEQIQVAIAEVSEKETAGAESEEAENSAAEQKPTKEAEQKPTTEAAQTVEQSSDTE